VKAFFEGGKPVAVTCHGPWTVIEAGAARGRRIAFSSAGRAARPAA
jgi:protease I